MRHKEGSMYLFTRFKQQVAANFIVRNKAGFQMCIFLKLICQGKVLGAAKC